MTFLRAFTRRLVVIAFVCSSGSSQTITYFPTDEEFAGPFASWKDVKTDFGAVGDGTTNDAPAIQRALNWFRDMPSCTSSALYFPRGTYRIDTTLVTQRSAHNDWLGFSMIGEDPLSTTMQWHGAAGGTMLSLDMWYGSVSRLAFNGTGSAGVALYRGDQFSTYCELSDLVFSGVQTGIQFGQNSGAGQAEHMVKRCHFVNCSSAGITTVNWNTLDIWIWHCLFQDCRRGCYNQMGNFHVYKSIFLRSTDADIAADNLCQFAFVGNTSVGSKCFFDWNSYQTWGSPVMVRGNRVYDFTGAYAMVTGNGGPWILADNLIRSPASSTGPAVDLTANDQVLIGNTFTVQNPVRIESGSWRGRLRVTNIDQQIVAASSLPPPGDSLPGTPVKQTRTVFEVARNTGNDAQALQQQIDAAAREPAGTRPVVHLARGSYQLSTTVTVPAGRDLQIIGDGTENGTRLGWSGAGTGPVVMLAGPSRAVVRDLEINGGNADAIVVANADQTGGRVYIDQAQINGPGSAQAAQTGLLVNGVEHSDITLVGMGHGGCATDVLVTGGPLLSSGNPAEGQVSILTGASANAGILYDVTGGGRLLAEAIWYEGSWSDNQRVHLSGSGALSIGVLQVATGGSLSEPTFAVDGYQGIFTLYNSGISGAAPAHWFGLRGSGAQMKVLNVGNIFWLNGKQPDSSFVNSTFVFRDSTSPGAQAAMLSCNLNGNGTWFASGNGFDTLANVFGKTLNAAVPDQHVRDCLGQVRAARIEPPLARAAGVTDVKFYRVIAGAGAGRTVLEVRASGAGSIAGGRPGVMMHGRTQGAVKLIALGAGGIRANIPRADAYDLCGRLLHARDLTPTAGRNLRAASRWGSTGIVVVDVRR